MTSASPPDSAARSATGRILIVDDNPDHVLLARMALESETNWAIDSALNVAQATELLARNQYRALVADYRLPDGEGLDLIPAAGNSCITIIMTAQGSEKVAVDAMQKGAYDYVVKDVSFPDQLPGVISKAVEKFDTNQEKLRQRATIHAENRRLTEVNQRLKDLDVAKSEFISTASHELRTPLTIIREFVAIMRDGLAGPITDEQRECLDSALSNSDRLEVLINDLLDLQKLESGRLRLRRRETDIGNLLQQCYHDFLPRYASLDQQLRLRIIDSLPPVLCDADKITQVIINLLGNAHKYAGSGGNISLVAHARDERVIISVEDDGPGISESDQQHVFEKFVQLDRQHGPGARGTGLGLAIAKNIVDLHEGDIWLRSTLGEGSAFFFTLPIYEEQMAVSALIKDRMALAEATGEKLSLSLLSIGPPDRQNRGDHLEDLIELLEDLQRIACEHLRRRDDETFIIPSCGMLAILTEAGAGGGRVIMERILTAAARKLESSPPLYHATVSITPGIDPDDWFAVARDRMTSAIGDAPDAASA